MAFTSDITIFLFRFQISIERRFVKKKKKKGM